MSGTVSQYQQGAFSSPANGQAGDASVVLGNDNAVRSKHNSHDADATIHVQSSALASRPGAGTAQRVWVTTDGKRAYLDSGTGWDELAYLSLADGGTVAGATTFSANVVINASLAVSSGVAATQGIGGQPVYVLAGGTSPVAARIAFASDDSGWRFAIAKNVGGVITDLATVRDDGLLTVSSLSSTGSITASGGVVGALTGNADTATKLATARTIAITGDLAYTSPSFDGSGNVTAAGTLATVNANVGTFGDASHAVSITVNAKGLITAVSTNAITAASVPASGLTGTTMAASVVTSSLTTVGALASGSIASGFGSINIGTQPLTAGITTLSSAEGAGQLLPVAVTIANTVTTTVKTGITSATRAFVMILGPNTVPALFQLQGTTASLAIANANFTTTNNNPTTTNVLVSAGNLNIQNETGGSVDYLVLFIGKP